MASEATPRVNAKYLDTFTNQTVRILGKVVSLRGETATINASGNINVHLNRVRYPNSVTQGGGTGGRIGAHKQCASGKRGPSEYWEHECRDTKGANMADRAP